MEREGEKGQKKRGGRKKGRKMEGKKERDIYAEKEEETR